jgi:hypothetical protein
MYPSGLIRIDEISFKVDVLVCELEHRLRATCGPEFNDDEAYEMLTFRTPDAGVNDLRDLLKTEDAIPRWRLLVGGHVRDEWWMIDALVLPSPIEGTAKGGEIAADSMPPYPGFRSPMAKTELKLWREISNRYRSLKSPARAFQVEKCRPVSD